jgi:hypothetical protein
MLPAFDKHLRGPCTAPFRPPLARAKNRNVQALAHPCTLRATCASRTLRWILTGPKRLPRSARYARHVTEFLRCDRHLARGFIHNAAFAAIATFCAFVTIGRHSENVITSICYTVSIGFQRIQAPSSRFSYSTQERVLFTKLSTGRPAKCSTASQQLGAYEWPPARDHGMSL